MPDIFFFLLPPPKERNKEDHHENQLQIFSHTSNHTIWPEKIVVRSFRGRQPHALRLKLSAKWNFKRMQPLISSLLPLVTLGKYNVVEIGYRITLIEYMS